MVKYWFVKLKLLLKLLGLELDLDNKYIVKSNDKEEV